MMEERGIRLNKYLSEAGFCSRREADKLIETRQVKVNGRIASVGDRITGREEIRVRGEKIDSKQEEFVYLAFNKPVGIECTTNRSSKSNIIDYICYSERIFPIGRLDKDSEGLIFMTNDGDIVNKILRHGNAHEKEYIVTVNKAVTTEFIKRMGNGIPILGTITKKCKVEKIDTFTFAIYLTQGLNRQIRRMCEFLGYEVRTLKRVRIMNVSLDVPLGAYRHLTEKEMNEINQLLASSSKTEEASKKQSNIRKSSTRPATKKRPISATDKIANEKDRGKAKDRGKRGLAVSRSRKQTPRRGRR